MAEAFGVVAGAASLAIILVDKAITLKKVLQKIKEAPVSIRRIERELQILADTLTVLDDVYRRESDPATSNLKKSIDDICRELLDKLNDLLSALKKRFERQQIWTWASIKVVLKQDEIKELSKRMSDVLQLLQIVNQMAFK